MRGSRGEWRVGLLTPPGKIKAYLIYIKAKLLKIGLGPLSFPHTGKENYPPTLLEKHSGFAREPLYNNHVFIQHG